MKNSSKIDLTLQLEEIYGISVVEAIKKKSNRSYTDPIYNFEDLRELLKTFLFYNTLIDNFYENHKPLTRFILITLEKYYGIDSINFSEPLNSYSMNYTWEIEHIIPKSDSSISDPNIIGNLTLLTNQLNTKNEYSAANFQTKKGIIDKPDNTVVKSLFLNNCFREYSTFGEKEINERTNFLLNKFNNIFYKDGDCTVIDNITIETFIEKLNLKDC